MGGSTNMAILKTSDAEAVRRRFHDELAGDVTIRFFTGSVTGLVVPGWEAESARAIRSPAPAGRSR